jgi:TonB-dependent heme/hemoglobin receptor
MMRALSTIAVTVAMAAAHLPASAQQVDTTSAEDQTKAGAESRIEDGEDEGRVFTDKIVVTASRREQASATTPAPIRVIDAESIETQQPEKVADLFKEIPGVQITGEGPFRGIPIIRGLNSNRILILVDGQRLNNARESTDFAGIQPALVDMSQVERVEVLSGPASVQYGSDAIGGVINIITRQPDLGRDEFTVEGGVEYGYGTSADSQRAQVSVTGTGDGFSFNLIGSWEDYDDYQAADGASENEQFADYVDSDDVVYNSGMEQSSFQGGLRFATGSTGVLRADVEVVRTDDIGFPGFDPASGIDISFPAFDRDKLGLGWESGPLWGLDDMIVSAYYQEVDKQSIRNLSFGFFFLNNSTRSVIDTYGINLQGVKDTGRHHLVFGIDFYRDELDDTTIVEDPFGTSNDVAVPDSTQTGLGVFIEDSITLSETVTLKAGLRGDTFDFNAEDDPDYTGEPFDVTDSDISGNLGLTWAVTDNVTYTALVGRGFRTPNLQERSFTGLATTGDTLILQNPDLKSERSLNWETGFKVRYDRYFGGFTVYYNDLTDFISTEFLGEDPDTGLQLAQFQNIDDAYIWGAELDLQTIFANWWTLFFGASYSEGRNQTDDQPLGLISPFKATIGLRYQRPRWWAEARTRIVSDLDDVAPGFDRSPGFTVYDLRAGYDLEMGLGFVVALENLTDKLYAETYNNRPEPGRNLRVAARYRF